MKMKQAPHVAAMNSIRPALGCRRESRCQDVCVGTPRSIRVCGMLLTDASVEDVGVMVGEDVVGV
jgi:hypothetical protein